jgi:high-affinity nickel-transport protein
VSAPPADALGLAALVFLLGLRHGFDPDHLVAIDGLTRSSRSRWNGLFFSLGHGAVVTLVGIAVAIAATEWQAPAWLQALGGGISIGVLAALGAANLAMALRRGEARLIGIRSRWFAAQLSRSTHPVFIAAVGAAFALSFDTISHAALFSFTGAAMAGWVFALLLGLVFTLGMALTDALNGLWVARLRGSRLVSAAIALLCLAIAASALGGLELSKPALSVASIVVLAAAYLLACRSIYGDGDSQYGTTRKRQAG